MNNIDNFDNFDNFHSTSGLSTKHWGPKGWYFLFSCIMGAYPVTIDQNNPEHLQIRSHFYNTFMGLSYTMPCSFCRNSYKEFVSELPIEPFLNGRIELMRWLYLIRDKVNQKLIGQEIECYANKKKELCSQLKNGEISHFEFINSLKQHKNEIFFTKESPPFEKVLKRFESIRAGCSPEAKTCAIDKK